MGLAGCASSRAPTDVWAATSSIPTTSSRAHGVSFLPNLYGLVHAPDEPLDASSGRLCGHQRLRNRFAGDWSDCGSRLDAWHCGRLCLHLCSMTMRLVILIVLILLNVVGLVLVLLRHRTKVQQPHSRERANSILMLVIGFWWGIVAAAFRPALMEALLQEWWLHVGLLLTALGFSAAIACKRGS